MKIETKLARLFTTLADAGKSTDNVASGILAIVAEAAVKDVEGFDPLVRAAYAANGWNPRPGRPTEETKNLEMVPSTVRTYVTTVRRAFRFGVPVAKMKSFYELRKALKKAKPPSRGATVVPAAVREHFAGVEIGVPMDVNGALVHDVGVLLVNLPKSHQTLFEKQLQALVIKYLPLARLQSAKLPQEQEQGVEPKRAAA